MSAAPTVIPVGFFLGYETVKLVPISRETHLTKKIRSRSTCESFRQTGLMPLYGAELVKAAQEFPLCFTREPDGFFPSAILAVEAGRNLFVAVDGQWLAGYVPAVMRRAPFALARVEETGNWVLCIDEESDLISESEGNPLFTEEGAPTPLIEEMSQFLSELERNRVATLGRLQSAGGTWHHRTLGPQDPKPDW